MDREQATKEIESYLRDTNTEFPSTETLEFCLALLKEENLIRKEDLMHLIRHTNFCDRPHWRKEEMLNDLVL